MFGCTFRRIQLKNIFQSSPRCRPQSAPEDRAQTDAKVQVGPLALQNLGAGGSGGGRLRRGWIDLDCRAVLELNLGLSGYDCRAIKNSEHVPHSIRAWAISQCCAWLNCWRGC